MEQLIRGLRSMVEGFWSDVAEAISADDLLFCDCAGDRRCIDCGFFEPAA